MEPKQAEFIIECLSVIKDSLVTMRSIYDRLPQLISKENKAIANLDMKVIEDLSNEKLQLSELASELMEKISKNFEKSFKWLGLAIPVDLNFAERISAIQSAHTKATDQGLVFQILEHISNECLHNHQEFKKSYDLVQPHFEVHRELTIKRLAQFRESYHFWAGIERELTGAYDKNGQKIENGTGSLIQTRA